ncbi:hypothetical protein [Sporolactobacillus sp. KGMB 08714]
MNYGKYDKNNAKKFKKTSGWTSPKRLIPLIGIVICVLGYLYLQFFGRL